jgi:hypothetical protein
MKTKWIASLILASAIAAPAFAQVGVYIGTAPPPLRYEVRPAIPGPGYSWVDGYWNWSGHRYVWVPGVWRRPPFEGGYWTHPHYDHYDHGWEYNEGHWDHNDHHDHHDWDHDHDHR